MNRVASRFDYLRKKKRKALIPYIMGGYPSLNDTPRLLELLASNGADLIEVGVPFSDPLADGPVIQEAGAKALSDGCTFPKLRLALQPVLRDLSIPALLMTYYNVILQRGPRRFFEETAEAGIAGLIIPDLPPDDAGEIRQLGLEMNLGLSFFAAVTSNEERIQAAADASTAFLYAVSLKGVTGVRDSLPPELPRFITKVKSLTEKPVAVGFGISKPEQASEVAAFADGVIIGSAIVGAVTANADLNGVKRFLDKIKNNWHSDS